MLFIIILVSSMEYLMNHSVASSEMLTQGN